MHSDEQRKLFWPFRDPRPLLFRDPRRWRDRWLDDLSQACDRYMRSPAFLDWMQISLKAMTELRALSGRGLGKPLPGCGPSTRLVSGGVRRASSNNSHPTSP